MIRSTSSGARPARSSACRAAGSATSEVAQSSGAQKRVRIRLDSSILSTNSGSQLSKRLRSSSFDTSRSGTYRPVDTILAYLSMPIPSEARVPCLAARATSGADHQTAVDRHDGAGDERRRVGGEEDEGVGDVLRLPH